MRTVYDINGADITSGAAGFIAGLAQPSLATIYFIGDVGDPNAVLITDFDASINWPIYGTFKPDVVKRGTVSSKVGLEVPTLDVTWSPSNLNFVNDITRTSPYQQASNGKFDGANFLSWTVYMSAPGVVYGFTELFGGRMGDCTVESGAIQFKVNSFLDVVNQQTPGSVIETLNSIAGFKGATPPPGLNQVPTFSVFNSVPGLINGVCLAPNANQVFNVDDFQGGFLALTTGTLAGQFSAIESNTPATISGTTYNQFAVFTKFPWNPSPGDLFYASATFPINQADGQYFGFPYVPDPSSAL